MKNSWKSRIANILFNLIFWICLFMFILTVRYYDIGNIAFAKSDLKIPNVRIYGNALLLGLLVGIPYSIMEVMLKVEGLYKHSLARIILNRTIIQYIITAFVLTFVASLNFYFDVQNGTIEPYRIYIWDYIFSTTVKLLLISALLGNIVLSIFRALQLKIGEDIFFELLIGKYNPAQEEDRAFLFIDLRSSTTIAEKLGHKKYSYFIQDCFKDLYSAVLVSKAMVYQYVGDEAVLTWKTPMGIKNNRCIEAYFSFKKQLESRKEYYQTTYGIEPFFKAGLHLGKVMTAEVGVIKREIAYHSDVLNTAARVQGLCNEKNANFLATQDAIDQLNTTDKFSFVEKGMATLRGKDEQVRIFEVKES